MNRLQIFTCITCSLIGGTLGYVLQDMWTAIVFASVASIGFSVIVGSEDDA